MENNSLKRSQLIKNLRRSLSIDHQTSEAAVKTILKTMSKALINERHIEIRGFGAFDVRKHKNKIARNPKTGEILPNQVAYKIHFKPGKDLRKQVLKLK
jgi:integration host factor subunit beta